MLSRRDFSRSVVATAAAAAALSACSQMPRSPLPSPTSPGAPSTAPHTSFAALKQIDAGLLNVGYAEDGPADGPPGDPAAWLALRHL